MKKVLLLLAGFWIILISAANAASVTHQLGTTRVQGVPERVVVIGLGAHPLGHHKRETGRFGEVDNERFLSRRDNLKICQLCYNTAMKRKHNLYIQWMPSSVDSLQVNFGIDNVFDELYVSHASRTGSGPGFTRDDYEPGRNYKLSASYEF